MIAEKLFLIFVPAIAVNHHLFFLILSTAGMENIEGISFAFMPVGNGGARLDKGEGMVLEFVPSAGASGGTDVHVAGQQDIDNRCESCDRAQGMANEQMGVRPFG